MQNKIFQNLLKTLERVRSLRAHERDLREQFVRIEADAQQRIVKLDEEDLEIRESCEFQTLCDQVASLERQLAISNNQLKQEQTHDQQLIDTLSQLGIQLPE